MVSYSDEPCLEMGIFFCTYLPCWSENFLLWIQGVGGGRGGGEERSEHVPHVVYETLKQWKLL